MKKKWRQPQKSKQPYRLRWHQNEDNIKIKHDLKNKDNLKIEDDLKKENNLKIEDDLEYEAYLKLKTMSFFVCTC